MIWFLLPKDEGRTDVLGIKWIFYNVFLSNNSKKGWRLPNIALPAINNANKCGGKKKKGCSFLKICGNAVGELFICNFSKETVHLLSSFFSLLPPKQSPLNMTLLCAQWVALWLLWFFFTQQQDKNINKGGYACGSTHLMEFDLRLSKPNLSLFCSVGIWGQNLFLLQICDPWHRDCTAQGGILVPIWPLRSEERV